MPPSGSPPEAPRTAVHAAILAGYRRSTRPLDRVLDPEQKTIRAPAQCAGFLSPGRQTDLNSWQIEARVTAGPTAGRRTTLPSRSGSRWRSESQESLAKVSRESCDPTQPGSNFTVTVIHRRQEGPIGSDCFDELQLPAELRLVLLEMEQSCGHSAWSRTVAALTPNRRKPSELFNSLANDNSPRVLEKACFRELTL